MKLSPPAYVLLLSFAFAGCAATVSVPDGDGGSGGATNDADGAGGVGGVPPAPATCPDEEPTENAPCNVASELTCEFWDGDCEWGYWCDEVDHVWYADQDQCEEDVCDGAPGDCGSDTQVFDCPPEADCYFTWDQECVALCERTDPWPADLCPATAPGIGQPCDEFGLDCSYWNPDSCAEWYTCAYSSVEGNGSWSPPTEDCDPQ